MATSHKRILGALRRKGPTRRNLFGPVDREQLQAEYQNALRKDLEEASKHWGFDFISNKPLESSNFQWECVPESRVPLLYRSCTVGAGQAEGQRSTGTTKKRRVEPPESEKENIPYTPERCALNLQDVEKTLEKIDVKRKQTNITDFYQAKRRVVGLPRKSGE